MKVSNRLGFFAKKCMSSRRSIVAAVASMVVLSGLDPNPAAADPLFGAPLSFDVGFHPECVAIGDFNGDGKPDLATANNGFFPGTVSVLLGNGDGTFAPKTDYEAAQQLTSSVAVGDVNRDGTLDLVATAFQAGESMMVFLGNGDGTFQPKIDLAGGGQSVAIGDLNGDGNLDLAAAGEFADNQPAIVRLGNGDGTFQELRYLPAGEHPMSVAIGDLNSDGTADLVVADNAFSVWVFLWSPDGTNQSGTRFPTTTGSSTVNSVAIGDLNKDGKPDLAVGGDFSISVLLGNGDGAFGPPSEYASRVSQHSRSIAISDLNWDGSSDVVVATSEVNYGGVLVRLGNGDGTLGPSTVYAAGWGPFSVAVGDFNRDGKPDVAAAGYISTFIEQRVSVLLNIGSSPPVNFQLHPHQIRLGSRVTPVTGTIRVPAPYDASQIDVASIRLNGKVTASSSRAPG